MFRFVSSVLGLLDMMGSTNVSPVLDIALGNRLPAEQESLEKSDSSKSDSDVSQPSSLSSVGSFKEADFRLTSIATGLDSLYKLASRIRNPKNRQQRPIEDLYKHIPQSHRAEYIKNQEHIDISLVMYVQQQQLRESVDDQQLEKLHRTWEELIAEYASESHWLVVRAGIANARRKQQFLYWKRHTRILGHDATEEVPDVPKQPADNIAVFEAAASTSQVEPKRGQSMATSVTKMDLTGIGPEDMRSVISHRTRVSTVISPEGEALVWPPAPTHLATHTFFPCPYCGYLCPETYLSQDNWR